MGLLVMRRGPTTMGWQSGRAAGCGGRRVLKKGVRPRDKLFLRLAV